MCWTCLLCRSQRFGGGQTRRSHRRVETGDTANQQCGGNTTDHGYRRHKRNPTLDVGVDIRNHDTQQDATGDTHCTQQQRLAEELDGNSAPGRAECSPEPDFAPAFKPRDRVIHLDWITDQWDRMGQF